MAILLSKIPPDPFPQFVIFPEGSCIPLLFLQCPLLLLADSDPCESGKVQVSCTPRDVHSLGKFRGKQLKIFIPYTMLNGRENSLGPPSRKIRRQIVEEIHTIHFVEWKRKLFKGRW
jgi:hypothetical protein